MLSRLPRIAAGLAVLLFCASGAQAASQNFDAPSQQNGNSDSSLFPPISLRLDGPASLYASSAAAFSDPLFGDAFAAASFGSFDASASIVPGINLSLGVNAEAGGEASGARSLRGPDNLFLWSTGAGAAYAGLANGASYVSTAVELGDGLHLQFGTAQTNPYAGPVTADPLAAMANYGGGRDPLDPRKVQASFAGLSWDFADWGGLGLTGSQTSEKNGLLGDYAPSLFNDSATTTALGVSARVGFGDGWVTTASFNEGVTQLDLRPNGLALAGDTLHSRAYGISVAKNGLFGNDALGFAVSRPLQLYGNDAAMIGIDRSLMLGHEHIVLASGTPETDFELGYVTTFMDGALALQANAAYQANLAGTNTNSLAVVSRAKINF